MGEQDVALRIRADELVEIEGPPEIHRRQAFAKPGLWAGITIRRQGTLVYLLALGVLLAGIGRLVSISLVGLPQPAVSRHLAYLRRTGLVSVRRDGVWMHYRVSPSLAPEIRELLDAAVRALTSVAMTARDRAQFQKAFGPLYVVPTDAGGACCTPRG